MRIEQQIMSSHQIHLIVFVEAQLMMKLLIRHVLHAGTCERVIIIVSHLTYVTLGVLFLLLIDEYLCCYQQKKDTTQYPRIHKYTMSMRTNADWLSRQKCIPILTLFLLLQPRCVLKLNDA